MGGMETQTAPRVPIWTIGDRLAKARDFADLTQADMADRLRVGRRSIVRYETSQTPPRSIVLAYSAVTNVPVEWLDGIFPGEMSVTDTYTTNLKSVA